MSGSKFVFIPILATGLVPTLHAGQVHRVGPGQTFAQITSAIAASANNDLILVDPGTFNAFTVDGAIVSNLSIIASSGSFAIAATAGAPEIIVRNVPLGSTVTIQGATISFADPNAPAIRVQNNPGAVRLSEVDVTRTGHMFTATIQAIVEVENTATFWMIDSSVWSDSALFANTSSTRTANGLANDGVSAIQLIDSGGMLQNSKFRGYHNDLNGLGNNGCGGDAVRAIGENTSIWLLEDNVSPGSPGFLAQFIAGSGNFGGHCVHQFRSVFAAGKITSCGGDDDQISLNMGPGARLHPGQGALGGVYAWNNDNNVTPSNPPGQVAFKMVKHCIENERRNETTLVSNVVSIGGNLDIRLRTRLDRRYLVVCSFVTEYTFSTPGFTGRAMAGPDFATIAGTSTGQVISPLTVAIPSLSNLIGKQVVVQSVFGPPGGVNFDNIGLPALAVIGP